MSTKSASGRLCTKVAKAKLISRLVLAFRTWSSSPIVRAADCTSLNVVSELGPFGLTSTRSPLSNGGRGMGAVGIDEHGNASGCRYQLTHELEPLCQQLTTQKIDS